MALQRRGRGGSQRNGTKEKGVSRRTTARRVCFFFLCALCVLCVKKAVPAEPAPVWPVSLVDVAERAGLTAVSVYGGLDRKRFIIETNGAGGGFLDYDNDRWVDGLLLSGARVREGAGTRKGWARD